MVQLSHSWKATNLDLINVASPKELVRLALPRRIPFHFVSTAGVARLAGQEALVNHLWHRSHLHRLQTTGTLPRSG